MPSTSTQSSPPSRRSTRSSAEPVDDILIAGGGIGGLTAALSLHRAGFPVRVFESVDRIQALGVGINLLPHAVRELDALGLACRARTHNGVTPSTLAYFTKRGEPIWDEPRGVAAGYRVAADLHPSRRAAHHPPRRGRGGRSVPTASTPAAISTASSRPRPGIEATFIDRRTGAVTATATGSMMIACDGIHSRRPQALLPGRGDAEVERLAAVARPRRRTAGVRRPHDDVGRSPAAEVRAVPGARPAGWSTAAQLHRRAAHRLDRARRARGLEQARRPRRLPPAVRGLGRSRGSTSRR